MAESVTSAGPDDDRCVVAFAGGGTAGHVFPGIAIAQELGRRILWIGSSTGVERKLVGDAGIAFHGIPAGKLRRYLSLKNLSDLAKTVAGIVSSVKVLRRARPALVFSKGGFVSVPPVIAARLCGIPSWTHESDFDPGLATRINLMFCEKVLVSFPRTVEFLPARYRGKAIVTGNPVRRALYHADGARGRAFVGCPAGVPLLFVVGGSDHIIPASLNRANARRYRARGSITDFREFEGRDHLTIVEPGWETVADFVLSWLDTGASAGSVARVPVRV
jgi:UDP-N-acetylglucosamine:LPS N-acetylglucosamine transferase